MSTNLLPLALHTQHQAKELDRRAIEAGTPGAVLMERAGQAAFSLLRESWPHARRLLVVCGGGNNGGDGYVVATLAADAGMQVTILALKPVDQLTGDAAAMAQRAISHQTIEWSDSDVLPPVDVIVDGLLGIGISGRVRDASARLIEKINASGVPVLSLDLPSGLNGDTGMVAGVAVRATLTLTFIAVKRGLLTGQGPAFTGRLFYDSLDLPETVMDAVAATVHQVDKRRLPQVLSARKADAHKGLFGHVLLIGGDYGFGGAIIMAAQAAIRCGAGLVSVATRAEHLTALLARQPEIMGHVVNHGDELIPLIQRASVVVIGPGLGQSEWAKSLLAQVMAVDKPQLWDADALNLLALQSEAHRCHQRVITPHPGEAARLLDTLVVEVQKNRFDSVKQLQGKYGGTVLLKGAGTLVYDGAATSLVAAGNPGMATGGMGDVLSGVIAALLAQGLAMGDAARFGALLHGMAADAVAAEQGQCGMVATDLLPGFPRLINGLA